VCGSRFLRSSSISGVSNSRTMGRINRVPLCAGHSFMISLLCGHLGDDISRLKNVRRKGEIDETFQNCQDIN